MKCPYCNRESKGVWSYSNGRIWVANREDGTRYNGRSLEVQSSSEQRGSPTTLHGILVEPMSPGLPSDNLQASSFVPEWNGLTLEPMSPGLPSGNLQASSFVPEWNGLTVEPMSPGLPSDNLQASLFIPERNGFTMPSINFQYSGNFTTGVDAAVAFDGLLGSSYHTNVHHEYPFDPQPMFRSHGPEVHPDALEHQRHQYTSEYRNVSDVQPASASRERRLHNVHRVSSRQEAPDAERLATQHRPGGSSSSNQPGGSSHRRRFF